VLAFAAAALPFAAHAFCGFYVGGAGQKLYNNATMVVMMRDGTRTVLSMQNNYQGPAEKFAMVVPVPVVLQKENVKTLPREVFDKIDTLAAPRLVEYWEQDPCRVANDAKEGGASTRYSAMPRKDAPASGAGYSVKVEAQFTVAEYEIVVLSAKDSGGLERWLHDNDYAIPDGAAPYLKPYVTEGWKFFVAKVDPTKVTFKDGQAMLSPLRFHYDSDDFRLPVRLGLINSNGTQDLIVHILARHQRYEVANYDNVFIPTNLDVAEAARDQFAPFYAALFDATLEKHKKAVVTEYAWSSASCDPCPGPMLDKGDILTLGGDTLADAASLQANDFVLTRLHARYSKDVLGDDLVFKAAPPVVGGREVWKSDDRLSSAGLEHGASPAGQNNFQGRYIIRHPWTGEITCANPKRGIWGGPPSGGPPERRAAKDLAFAPRGGIALASLVRQDVPELELEAAAAPLAAAVPDAGAAPGPTGSSGSSSPANKKGCGCVVAAAPDGSAAGAALLAGLALLTLRRRRR
jgi:MYXO-CTERM domain-containing protein